MRVTHILKGMKSNETVHEAIWFDTETKPEKVAKGVISHRLWFGWACYRRRVKDGKWGQENWFRFTTRDEFWHWVDSCTREKTKLWMFCHNTSFDLPVLDVFGYMERMRFKITTATLESPPTVLSFRSGTRTVTIVDTLNIWRTSLASIGKQIGVPKLDMPDANGSEDDWNRYGKQDVQVIMSACILWWKMLLDLDMGGFAPTLAAQSMRVFRHKYMRHEILIDTNENALELSRSAYHGGRTEAHFIGRATGEFYLLDVNSMYPAVMAKAHVPIRIIGFTRRASIAELQRWVDTSCVVAEVQLQTGENFAPFRREGKLLFPTGRFNAVLSTSELQYALERGYITIVRQVAVYERAIAFADYMNDIWERRSVAIAAGDTVLAQQLKTLVNAFYGKWGQSGAVWLKVGDVPTQAIKYEYEIDAQTGAVYKYREFGGIRQKKSDAFESANSFPAIAAHVTAAARMELYQLMITAGASNVYYCDTDSLLVNRVGYDRLQHLINPHILGMLKLEGVYDQIRIWGAKDYVFGTKVRQKGIRPSAIVIGENTYEQDRWLSFKGLLRAGITDQALTMRVRKHLKRTYDKGHIQPDGRVLPFHYF